jgi:ferredoxin
VDPLWRVQIPPRALFKKVFVVESGEKASIVEKYQTKGPAQGEVSDDLSSHVHEAADGRPVEVIAVE